MRTCAHIVPYTDATHDRTAPQLERLGSELAGGRGAGAGAGAPPARGGGGDLLRGINAAPSVAPVAATAARGDRFVAGVLARPGCVAGVAAAGIALDLLAGAVMAARLAGAATVTICATASGAIQLFTAG